MSNKKIKPSENLTRYLDETFQLEKMKQKKLERHRTIYDQIDPKVIRNNDEKKVRTIDNHVFKSMANLTYFFEFLNLHPQLIDKFGEDVEDLLGLKTGEARNPKGEGIVRFLIALLAEWTPDNDDEGKFNYRRRMLKTMQYLINQKVGRIVTEKKEDPRGYEDRRFAEMITQDMKRAEVWTSFLDRVTGREADNPKRVIDFDIVD